MKKCLQFINFINNLIRTNSGKKQQLRRVYSPDKPEVSHFVFGKVIGNFKRSLLCITGGMWSLEDEVYKGL